MMGIGIERGWLMQTQEGQENHRGRWRSKRYFIPAQTLVVGILIASALVLQTQTSSAQEGESDAQRILVLHSYHPQMGWTAGIDDGIRNAINEGGLDIELYVEYMDTKRFTPRDVIPYLESLYVAKYSSNPPDVIIASDDNALSFLLEVRETLFPGVQVVFCGVSNIEKFGLENHTGLTGVVEDFDLRGTIELALTVHPETKNVVIINDATPTGLNHSRIAHSTAEEFGDRVDFIFLEGLTADELQGRCEGFSDDTVVILLSFYMDREGHFYTTSESLSAIQQHCDFPIYTAWDYYIGYGVTGGVMTSGELQGRNAAELALRILRGESVDDIEIITESQKLILFDYNLLHRYGISPSLLPEGSRIINEPDTFYYRNKTLVWGIIVFIIIQTFAIVVLLVNMNRRKRAEEALRESEERYRSLVENSPVAILLHKAGIITYANSKAVDLHGASDSGEIIGKNLLDFVHPDSREKFVERLKQVAEGPKKIRFMPLRLIRLDGKEIEIETTAMTLDRGGDTEHLIVCMDVTERKRAEKEIICSNEELEAALKVKTEFLSMVSHELRTPLVPIIGYAEVLLDGSFGELPDEAIVPVKTILKRANDLVKLIEDLLVLSRLERGSMKLEIEPLPVTGHLNEIVDDYRSRTFTKGVKISWEGPDITVLADHTRLHQILTNLIDNSVKYSGDPVEVKIITDTRDGTGVISVVDNGIGISPKHQEQIFDRFYQVEAVDTRSQGGAGLGLAIIKELAEGMGGRIVVESEYGRGSTFTVELPLHNM